MINKLLKNYFKKDNLLEGVLFFLVFTISLIKFRGLLHNGLLTGLDNSSHFYTLYKLATDYIPHGHLSGYLLEWSGGISLFRFYNPFLYIFTSILWIILLKSIPLFLLFRILLFILIPLTSVIIWFLTRSFYGKQVSRWSILLSLLFILYPKFSQLYGMGAASLVNGGLESGYLGLLISILWISFLKLLHDYPNSKRYFFLSTIASFVLILSHMLSFVVSVFIFGILLISSVSKNKLFVKNAFLSFFLGLLLSSFWLIPVLTGLRFTSGIVENTIIVFQDPLLILFPFNPNFLFDIHTVFYFNFSAFVLFIISLIGLIKSIQDKKWFIPIIFFNLLCVLVRDYFSTVFPQIYIHYNRFIPFLYIFTICLGSYGLNYLWNTYIRKSSGRNILFGLSAILIFIQAYLHYDFSHSYFFPDFLKTIHETSASSPDRFEKYPLFQETNIMLGKLKQLKIQRILVQIPYQESSIQLGSPNYFTSAIPFYNNQSVLVGLYAESSPLTPYIMPTTFIISKGTFPVWGDYRLIGLVDFVEHDPEFYIRRLELLGVDYVLAYSPEFIRVLKTTNQADFIDETAHYKLFKLKNTYPLIYTPPYKSGAYINFDGKTDFRDIALTLFESDDSVDYHIIEVSSFTQINKIGFDNLSSVIVSASNITQKDFRFLLNMSKPLILLNPPAEIMNIYYSSQSRRNNVFFVKSFELLPKTFLRYKSYPSLPSGWKDLQQIILKIKSDYKIDLNSVKIMKSSISNELIQIDGNGPAVVNIGYSSYWGNKTCKDCTILRTNPDQLIVNFNGQVSLDYQNDYIKQVSNMISFVTATSLVIYFVMAVWKKGKNNF